MSLVVAILLGVIQGLTEFFPVSSSGHLALFGAWFGMDEPDLVFDILLHVATLFAIVVYFRRDWITLAGQLLGRGNPSDLPKATIWYLVLATIPAGFVGVFLGDQVAWLHGQVAWVGALLCVTATLLFLGYGVKGSGKNLDSMGWVIVLVMGIAQAFAILPGISRSGATIMVGVFMGLNRKEAARFSFLMAVPVIAGAAVLAVKEVIEDPALAERISGAYAAGFVAAFVAGFVALAFMMKLLEGRRFYRFAWYCLALGLYAILTG